MLTSTILVAKLIHVISKTFKKGAGYTFPGYIALKSTPCLLKRLIPKIPRNIILVTGTNGKTTTTKIISHILQKNNYKVLTNTSGANLLNGLVSTILLNMTLFGKLDKDICVFEVDELFFPSFLSLLAKYSKEKQKYNVTILMLNVSRDQLDRYFEPDKVLSAWESVIKDTPLKVKIVLDGTHSYFQNFLTSPKLERYLFDDSFTAVTQTPLEGAFNAKNVNASLLAAKIIGIPPEKALASLKDFKLAYGRGEEISYNNKNYRLLLAKNPASFNNNLQMLLSGDYFPDALLFILNDNIPDGRDVSWIYDIDPSLLYSFCESKQIFVSGTRCMEMALRLDYAGVTVTQENISKSIKKAVRMITSNREIHDVLCFPNYSSMLELRKVLVGRSIL